MSSMSESELLESLELENKVSLRRISRMIAFMDVLRKTEHQVLRSLEEGTGPDPGTLPCPGSDGTA